MCQLKLWINRCAKASVSDKSRNQQLSASRPPHPLTSDITPVVPAAKAETFARSRLNAPPPPRLPHRGCALRDRSCPVSRPPRPALSASYSGSMWATGTASGTLAPPGLSRWCWERRLQVLLPVCNITSPPLPLCSHTKPVP